ncbi:MAG: metalloregulator ArsR/SmtB family transcription factor [Dehalococcoidales bacterium]|nr:metalloregulator ArsR/SmtB family transcription factor [Dehalococcoidales bacterium]
MAQQKTEEQVAVFSVLADSTRLKLVKLLCQRGEHDALCVNALSALLGVTQSAVSQHLRVLKAIGLVKGIRRGYHIHYSINAEVVERCRNIMSAALSIEEPAEQNAYENCNEGRKQDVL